MSISMALRDTGRCSGIVTGNFVGDILDDLSEETISSFMISALSRFVIPYDLDHIVITTDGYHYESILATVEERMHILIRRQRCLFHIEKDLAHTIKDSHRKNHTGHERRGDRRDNA